MITSKLRYKWLPAIVAILLLFGASTCQLATTAQGSTSSTPTASATATTSSTTISQSDFTHAISQVATAVKPAVVQITTEQSGVTRFNEPYTVPSGVGSGIIYDSQGHILTNNHVVEGASKLEVSLPDGRSFTAKLIGADPQTDLAVIQISGDNLPVAALGDSGQLQVGDWVVAIGNALALSGGPTVTTGVVSALDRTVQEPGDTASSQGGPYLYDVIQTDAPINPGNSGGPLVNLAGQVVGINTLVAGSADGIQSQGIGFAISINTAKPIADQLVASGKVDHAYLGITYQPLDASAAAQLGISQTKGVLVMSVVAGGPAEKAGLQAKDVITEIDGKVLQSDSDLAQAIGRHKPGDVATLTVARGSQTLSLKVTLGTMPS
jgi:serine protease Do